MYHCSSIVIQWKIASLICWIWFGSSCLMWFNNSQHYLYYNECYTIYYKVYREIFLCTLHLLLLRQSCLLYYTLLSKNKSLKNIFEYNLLHLVFLTCQLGPRTYF